jgi:hypothetical protein
MRASSMQLSVESHLAESLMASLFDDYRIIAWSHERLMLLLLGYGGDLDWQASINMML